ncbi:hypothetical protein AAW12_24445 [Sphingobacterium sp. Ag1]|uniref:hypothetical protein n=1 Tax=Sphingobacterium sp. Ag1 TaxID=1643451 RepID=UPI0006279E2A|nr:hypothetical protein [Sphingobacterium sp. Ag1]KKO89256.1 hypothetical protein AAW12_24445 [Sphingobacterium sp. Ag1]
MTVLIGRAVARDPSASSTKLNHTDDLKTRVAALEKSVEDTRFAEMRLQDKNATERFRSSMTLIRSGLENGTQIESTLLNSIKLLTLADITIIPTDINNPTSNSLGTSFPTWRSHRHQKTFCQNILEIQQKTQLSKGDLKA